MTATFGSNYWSPTAATLVIKCNSYAKLAYYDAYFKYIQTIYYTNENSICVTMFDLKKCSKNVQYKLCVYIYSISFC